MLVCMNRWVVSTQSGEGVARKLYSPHVILNVTPSDLEKIKETIDLDFNKDQHAGSQVTSTLLLAFCRQHTFSSACLRVCNTVQKPTVFRFYIRKYNYTP